MLRSLYIYMLHFINRFIRRLRMDSSLFLPLSTFYGQTSADPPPRLCRDRCLLSPINWRREMLGPEWWMVAIAGLAFLPLQLWINAIIKLECYINSANRYIFFYKKELDVFYNRESIHQMNKLLFWSSSYLFCC